MNQTPALPPARKCALEALEAILGPAGGKASGVPLQAALDRILRFWSLSSQDTALCTTLVYGYLRLKGRLEYMLAHFLKDPLKLPPDLLRLLGLAALELTTLDRIPARATVHWAVDEARLRHGPGLGRLTNAVLRNLDRLGPDARSPDFFAQDAPEPAVFLSRFHAMPVWLVRMWLSDYGRQATEDYLLAQTREPPLGLRCNFRQPRARALHKELSHAALAATGRGLALDAQPRDLSAWLEAGLVSRQSLASQQVLEACDPAAWPGRIWDACAGYGGKTAQLLESGHKVWLATDINLKRLVGLRAELDGLGLPAPWLAVLDASEPAPLNAGTATLAPAPALPGTVVLDAPCSGLGVLARRPDIKWKLSRQELRDLADLQSHMLETRFRELPAGGRLVYITCTLNPAENDACVDELLHALGSAREILRWATPHDSPLREFFFASVIERKG